MERPDESASGPSSTLQYDPRREYYVGCGAEILYGKRTSMKTDLKDNRTLYINTALVIAIILVLIFMTRFLFVSGNKNAPASLKQNNRPVISQDPSEFVYDIDKVKRAISGPAGDNAEYSDLEEMYKNSDKTDVGGNMVEAWRRVKPEDRARLSDGFDKQIAAAQETLKKDSGNKHAKNLLYISGQLKKMSSDGFNYKLKNRKL